MSVLVVVQGERFVVETRTGPDGRWSADFAWTNGPADGTYGFTVGGGAGAEGDPTPAQLERMASDFVRAFFADDGIGPADFPDFVESRRS